MEVICDTARARGNVVLKLQETRDRRCSPREAVGADLRVYSNGQRPCPGRIRNLSIGGVFAEIDSTTLSPNAYVDLAFVLRVSDGASHHFLPAQVIWIGTNGVGLMFTDFRQETMQVLRAAVRVGMA